MAAEDNYWVAEVETEVRSQRSEIQQADRSQETTLSGESQLQVGGRLEPLVAAGRLKNKALPFACGEP